MHLRLQSTLFLLLLCVISMCMLMASVTHFVIFLPKQGAIKGKSLTYLLT